MNEPYIVGIYQILEQLAQRVDKLLPEPPLAVDWKAMAFHWRYRKGTPYLHPLQHTHAIRLKDLLGIERQLKAFQQNMLQFVQGYPANNVLLWGARGTGKSSLVKASFNEFCNVGLRLIEVDKQHLVDLFQIVELVAPRPERFVIFCDDLSFEADDASYKALKVALDGSLTTSPDNILICATSNRRHMLPEYMSENQQARMVEGELHLADVTEEKLSLVERFGVQLSFHPFNQQDYLAIVHYWLQQLGTMTANGPDVDAEALRWALDAGSRSGRTALQFAKHWAGQNMCK